MLEREFIGFVPDDFLDLYLDAMLRRVAEQAPYESSCRAGVERTNTGYLARIDVNTANGIFAGEGKAPDPKVALDLAEEQLIQRLELWRKTRWAGEAA